MELHPSQILIHLLRMDKSFPNKMNMEVLDVPQNGNSDVYGMDAGFNDDISKEKLNNDKQITK